MVGVYIAVAVLAVLLVSFFVDQLPENLYTKSSNVKGEIVDLILSTGKQIYRTRSCKPPRGGLAGMCTKVVGGGLHERGWLCYIFLYF